MQVLALLLSACLVFADVLNLTPEDFCPLGMPGTWVVKFFSPYCHGCKLYAPVFLESVDKLRADGTKVQFGQVNCVEQGDLCKQLEVTGWPALKVFRDGEFFLETKVNRESPQILVDFVKDLPVEPLNSDLKDESISSTYTNTASALIAPAKIATVSAPTLDSSVTDTITTSFSSPSASATTSLSSITDATSASAAIASSTESEHTDVTSLKDVPESGLHFIKFFSPYCFHCLDFAPVWERLAREYPDAHFDEINCIENGDVCAQQKVKAWPAVKGYRDGKLESEYPHKEFDFRKVNTWLVKNFKADLKKGDENSTDLANTAATTTTEEATKTELSIFDTPAPLSTGEADFIPSNLPGPVWTEPMTVTHANGESISLNNENFKEMVENSNEPWMIKFFHPMCPHCQAMAPEWEKYAQEAKGKMNVAQVSCEGNFELCLNQGIVSYPTIFYYVRDHKRMYTGGFTAEEFANYHRFQTGAQILHVRSKDELSGLVDAGAQDGVGTFIYLYDESVTTEDWESLMEQAQYFPNMNSVMFHSSSKEIREHVGVKHHGTALIYASKWTNPENNERQDFYHAYPLAHSPKDMRDTDAVIDWVNTVRFASPVALDVDQVPHLSGHAGVTVVQLVPEDAEHPKLAQAAKRSHEDALNRQSELQKSMRDQRGELADKYRARGKDSIARAVTKTPINAPFVIDRAYSFITIDDWKEQFARWFETEAHEAGDVVLVDWYNRKYVDNINGNKLSLEDVDEAKRHLEDKQLSKKKLKAKFSKLPRPTAPVTTFRPDLNLGQNIASMEKKHQSFSGLVLAVLAFIVGRFLYKKGIAYYRSRGYSRGPILTGKMD